MVACSSQNEVVIGPCENGFPSPAVALNGPASAVSDIADVNILNYVNCKIGNVRITTMLLL